MAKTILITIYAVKKIMKLYANLSRNNRYVVHT